MSRARTNERLQSSRPISIQPSPTHCAMWGYRTANESSWLSAFTVECRLAFLTVRILPSVSAALTALCLSHPCRLPLLCLPSDRVIEGKMQLGTRERPPHDKVLPHLLAVEPRP